MTQTPTPYAFLICDHTLKEGSTGKYSLIGLFDRIHSTRFPTVHGPLSVYLAFSDAYGSYDLQLEVSDLEDNSILHSMRPVQLQVPDRLQVIEVDIRIDRLALPHPGKYEMRMLMNGEPIAQRVLTADQIPVAPSTAV